MKITAEQWQELEPLVDQALDLSVADRDTWLRELDTARPALAPLLREILARSSARGSAGGVETTEVLARSVPKQAHSPGERIGSFELLRTVGRGGMGEVWLARQTGDGAARDVALKLPLLLGAAGLWQERFKRERDILARLQHPHIATLYEAGFAVLAEGASQPYLAMEFVQGESLVEYASAKGLDTVARLALFRQVLSAVSFAHRQLVVHRDLKPANILVNDDGEVKLLDFGIAKLLEDEDPDGRPRDELTRLTGRLLTLRYASPEQVDGGHIGTATDIYALGVVLHELLTGQSPYRSVREGRRLKPADVVDASGIGLVKLDPDLDAILLLALRTDPAQRYATVEQFDDDLRRHLEHRPVLARRGDRRYRMGRFVTRNRLPLSAAAAVLLVLIGGLVAVDRARREAVTERNRAERHFQSVRTLANRFIYDIEAKLRGLAGTLPVRKELAETSIQYLDSLAAEAQGDPALMAEIGGGYRRLGEVLDGVANGNIGDHDAAVENFSKAARLLDDARAQGFETVKLLEDQQRVHYELTELFFEKHDSRWKVEALKSQDAQRRLVARPDATAAHRVLLPGLILEFEHERFSEDPRARPDESLLAEARQRLDAVAPTVGKDLKARGNLAVAYYTLGALLNAAASTPAELERALDSLEPAGVLIRAVAKDAPDDLVYASQVDMIDSEHAAVLRGLGRYREAEAEMAAVLLHSRSLTIRDPANADLKVLHVENLVNGVLTAYDAGNHGAVISRSREAWQLWAGMPRDQHDRLMEATSRLAKVDYYGGLSLLRGSRLEKAEGCQHLHAAEAFLAGHRKAHPGEDAAKQFDQLPAALEQCRLAEKPG